MNHRDFVKLLSQLASLSTKQRSQMRGALDGLQNTSAAALASILRGPDVCPNCEAPAQQLRPWGHSHGLARMRCHAR